MDRTKGLSIKEKSERKKIYIELIESINLTDFKKSRDIVREMNISAREWRKCVEDIMNFFIKGELDFMIISTSKGYKKTSNIDEISHYIAIKENQFKSLANYCRRLKKTLLEFKKENLFDKGVDF